MAVELLDDLIRPLREDPARSALLFDFDGTLSPTVPDPDDARPMPGAVELLDQLASRYWRVAAVSGRPLSFLRRVLPASVVLSGQYGLELHGPGVEPQFQDLGRWRKAVDEAVERAVAAEIAGMRVEPKGETLTLHWREHPEVETAVVSLAATLAEATGLITRPAKKSVELHPPIPTDKGTAVRYLADGAESVLYVGDDVGDLPAFDALAGLRREGLRTVALAVASVELPEAVAEAADGVVDGTSGTVALLHFLLG